MNKKAHEKRNPAPTLDDNRLLPIPFEQETGPESYQEILQKEAQKARAKQPQQRRKTHPPDLELSIYA